MSRAPISAVPSAAKAPERLPDRGRLVRELRFAGTGGFAIRSADEPVVGLHRRVGEEQLPLDGADREDREAAVSGSSRKPVGEVALPLPAQPRDPMRRDSVEEAFRDIEALDVLDAFQQPVGVGGIGCPARTAGASRHRVTPASAVSSSSRCSRSRRSTHAPRRPRRTGIRTGGATRQDTRAEFRIGPRSRRARPRPCRAGVR